MGAEEWSIASDEETKLAGARENGKGKKGMRPAAASRSGPYLRPPEEEALGTAELLPISEPPELSPTNSRATWAGQWRRERARAAMADEEHDEGAPRLGQQDSWQASQRP